MPPWKVSRGGRKDDLAAATFDHCLADLAGQDELGIEVHFDDLVPVFVRVLGGRRPQDCAGIVDQDVDHGMCGVQVCNELMESGTVGEVTGIGMAVAANGLHRFGYIAAVCFQGGTDGDDVCACLGQCHGHGFADAAFGTSHQRGLAGKVKLGKFGHYCTPSLTADQGFHG